MEINIYLLLVVETSTIQLGILHTFTMKPNNNLYVTAMSGISGGMGIMETLPAVPIRAVLLAKANDSCMLHRTIAPPTV